jgi:phosphoglycolate phosphatase
LRKVDLIIFDLDGTLVDSRADIATALNRTLIQYGLPIYDEVTIGKYVATGVRPLLMEAASKSGLSDLSGVISSFEDAYAACLTEASNLYEGMRDLLDSISSVRLAVITNKQQKFVAPILRALKADHFFTHAFGREAFEKMKPDPMPIVNTCAMTQVKPDRCIMVGDTAVDIRAACAAGALSCGVLYGYGAASEFATFKPTFIAANVTELRDVLTGLI